MEQTESQVILHLDIYFSSDLLILKIRDIPMKEKLEKLVAPILQGITKEQYIYDGHLNNLDLIRDGRFIRDELAIQYKHLLFRGKIVWYEAVKRLGLWNDREFVLQIVKYDGSQLSYVKKKELLEDRDIILESIRSRPRNYEIVKDTFRDDKEITLIAVSKDPMNIRHAPKELRGDRDVAKCALLQSGYTIKYIPQELKKDKEFISNIFNNDKNVIEYIYSLDN